MARPQFTQNEEYLIAHVRNTKDFCFSQMIGYGLFILIGASSFTWGLMLDEKGALVSGFAMILFLSGYFIYYQFKPDWNLKTIIDKYEKAFESAVHKTRVLLAISEERI